MHLLTVLSIIERVDLLKNTLLHLPRIKDGAITAGAKKQVKQELSNFSTRMQAILKNDGDIDEDIQVLIDKLMVLSVELESLPSNSKERDGNPVTGYQRIEIVFADIVNTVGFIKGYLYAYSKLYTQRRNGADLNELFGVQPEITATRSTTTGKLEALCTNATEG
jgi:hypothetical protein